MPQYINKNRAISNLKKYLMNSIGYDKQPPFRCLLRSVACANFDTGCHKWHNMALLKRTQL